MVDSETRVNKNYLPIAIYNTDEKKLMYVAFCIAEATRIIFNSSTITTDGLTRRCVKNRNIITKEGKKNCTILGYNVAVREANTEQRIMLGKEKFVKC